MAWQNPRCQFPVPSHNSGFSYSGVPAAAGMDDWYENSYPLPPNSSFSRKRESRGEGWHEPHPNTSNDQVSFSYLGVPASRAIAMQTGAQEVAQAAKCNAGACPPLGRRNFLTTPQPTRDRPRSVIRCTNVRYIQCQPIPLRTATNTNTKIAKQNPARWSRPERRLDSGRQPLSNRTGSKAKH